MLLTSPVVWWGDIVGHPSSINAVATAVTSDIFGVLVWSGALLLALSKVVLVLLNRTKSHLKEEAGYER
ncbi:hypothetical protein [Aeromonas jandaei]|uniref:hypothetical protein n=1 Tax=Aeromonas jandaei TaxID=650 RepID=UPI0039857D29